MNAGLKQQLKALLRNEAQTEIEHVISVLERLTVGIIDPRSYGICDQLDRAGIVFSYKLVSRIAPYWEHFSGDENYPIPGSDVNTFYEQITAKTLWEGELGELRKSLAAFMVETLKEYCNDRCS